MESPVVLENCAQFTKPVEQETGFPFDDSDYESDNHFQARLNDIASRHPEFATHFRGFDDFPSTLRRKRHTSGSSGEPDDRSGPSSAGPSHRFADHSFPSGFNRFPFTRHFEEEFAQEPHREDKPPEVPKQQEKRGRKPNPYLPQHLSNTVDLGQKQPPVQETRSQRSMSAPPENRAQSSRVEQEPSNVTEEVPVMGKTFSRQPPQPQQPSQPKERIIPIHVEGRDDPVMPKNSNLSSGGSAEKVFGGERVHTPQGRQQHDPHAQYRRQMYDQFAPQTKQQMPPQNQQQPPQQHQQPFVARQQTPPSQQSPRQQTPPSQQPPRQQATPPPTGPQSNDPLDKIKSVRSDVMELMTSVEQFRGTRKDREYLYLDEMLTRNLLKLDNIETEGKENIRLARKEAIKCIQTCINNLEAKAQAKEKELKNSGESIKQQETVESVPETTEQPQKSESTTSLPEKQQTDASYPPKFTSQATLIISPPKTTEPEPQKVEDQQQQPPVENMEVEPSVESKESTETVASTETTDSQNSEQLTSEISVDSQLAAVDSSQTADKDTTQK